MQCKWFSSTGILLSMVLTVLPCSVAVEDRLYSSLSPTPISYGNWFPLLGLVFALLALVFLLLRRDYGQMAPVTLGLSIASHVLSWSLFCTFSLTGAAVVLLQLAVLLQKKLPPWRLRQLAIPE